MRASYLRVYDIRHHPKTRRLARALGVDRPTAVGLVTQLWMVTMSLHADEGDLEQSSLGADAAELAEELGWTGDAQVLVDALRSSGWLDEWVVHDWTEEQSSQVSTRLAARELGHKGGKASGEARKERQATEGSESDPQSSNSDSRSASRSGSATATPSDANQKRKEKKRKDKKEETRARPRDASPAAASALVAPAADEAAENPYRDQVARIMAKLAESKSLEDTS